jgi:hypothetical protein
VPQDLAIYLAPSGRENLMFFARLVGHGASITGILPQLGVLAAYAAVLLTLAAWRLRRVLSG